MLEAVLRSMEWLQYVALAGLWGLLLLAERWAPRRSAQAGVWARWRVNLGLYALGVVVMLAVQDTVQPAAIRLGSQTGWGGLAAMDLPDGLKIVLGVCLADLIQYGLHWLAHRVPVLWRLHQVHHADVGFDVSTSVRHHPLEVLVLTVLTLLLCAAVGMPWVSLVLYGGVHMLHSAFCHANIALPPPVDRWLRQGLVTPDMHRVHHSANMGEGNRNFGLVFPWWDRLLGTYVDQPALGHEGMALGLADAEARHKTGWWRSLRLPFERLPP